MEVAKAIRALSTGTVIRTANEFCKTWSRLCRDIVAVPVRHPTNSDFLAECVCRKRTTLLVSNHPAAHSRSPDIL
jgi:hypothetical protein